MHLTQKYQIRKLRETVSRQEKLIKRQRDALQNAAKKFRAQEANLVFLRDQAAAIGSGGRAGGAGVRGATPTADNQRIIDAHHRNIPPGQDCPVCLREMMQITKEKRARAADVDFRHNFGGGTYASPDKFPQGGRTTDPLDDPIVMDESGTRKVRALKE